MSTLSEKDKWKGLSDFAAEPPPRHRRLKHLFIYYLFLILYTAPGPPCANTSKWSAGSRVRSLGPSSVFSGASERLWSSVCYRTPSLQPKYQTTGVNYNALYDHSLLQPTAPTLLGCQCKGPRFKSQICSGCRGNWTPDPSHQQRSVLVLDHQGHESLVLVTNWDPGNSRYLTILLPINFGK